MGRTAQIYEKTIPANGSDVLLVEGGFYKVLAATGAIKISREGGSAIGPILPGQGERENFRRLTIQNLTAGVNTVRILVADESFEDTRIYGEVSVIDGGRSITMANKSFGGYAQQAATVGNFAHVQLWNPVGRTVNIAVSKIIMNSVAGSGVNLRWFGTPLTTLALNPNSKKIGVGPNSTAELRNEANAAILGNAANLIAWIPAIVALQVDFKEPIIIQPGMGLVVANQNVNTYLTASFDFYEFTP